MSRAAQILNALESTRAASAEEFAGLLGVSRRTVAGEVAALQEVLGAAASITLADGRYRLLVADPPRYRAVRSGLDTDTSFNDPMARVSYIIARLFRALIPVRIEELAHELSVGRTTVVGDLARVRAVVAEWDLIIQGRTHVGLTLEGPELQQRLLVLKHHYTMAYGHHPQQQAIAAATSQAVLTEGRDAAVVPELSRWATVALDRVAQGRALQGLPPEYQELIGTPSHALAERLAGHLAAIGSPLDGDEVTFLALPIAGMRAPSSAEFSNSLVSPAQPVDDLVRGVLQAIATEMEIDLSGTAFLAEFTRHLAYMLNRMRYQMWVDDSGVASIGDEFPVAHRMATVAQQVIEERVGLPVDNSELGFLVAYFQVFLEAVDRHPRVPLQVAILIGAGRVTAELVRLQLTRLLPTDTQYRLLPAHTASPERLRGVDLVVVTGEDTVSSPAPVLQVHRLLDRKALARELDRLHLRLPGGAVESNGGVLANALDEHHFFAMAPGTEYADAVDYMTGHLEARGLVEAGFGHRIRERELHSPTQLDPWVGFPHTTLSSDTDVLLAVGVVPRRDDEDGVRLIVLLGVPQDPRRSENILVPVYDAVLRLGTRRDLLTRISQLTSFEQFYYFLASNPLTES